jgi:type I restriction enzyme M protein
LLKSKKMSHKKLIQQLGFQPKENVSDIFIKKYADNYCIEIDFKKEFFNYGNKIIAESKTTQNFSQDENWVVLECVDRLLIKGYKPENITLEKTWKAGHQNSGRLDICVANDKGDEFLLIECKTYGAAFDKEFAKMKKDGGQLFTYFKFSNKANIIMLYASELNGDKVIYKNEIVKIEEDYRFGDVKDFHEKWNKLTKDNGVFEEWVNPYNFISKALTINELVEIKPEDSSFIFNRFLEILRHNVVSDKGNAFNRIFTLFLCKIYDEKDKEGTNEELEFQWIEGENHRDFQLRLTDLYKKGMHEFLEKRVTDFSETEFNNKYHFLQENDRRTILEDFYKIRLEKNNEFAIKDVYDEDSFNENAVVVKEVVELLQNYKIRYTKKQQYLSDFFELLLTTGLKQESGQFFTPVPIAQFIIKSLPLDKIIEDKLAKGVKEEYLPYVMDYAAGSGHFLTESMHEIQRLLDYKIQTNGLKAEAKKFVETSRINHFDWALKYVYGIEKDYRLVKVGKVGCYLHGDGLANVIHSDGLARFGHPDYKLKLLEKDKDFPKDNKAFDIVVSNPPYSVASFKNTTSKYYKTEDFDLYAKLTDNSSEIECLFIERTKQLLKNGGLAGIILPSSILSNTGIYTKSREIILQHFDIVAIAELGSNTFMATGTNTVTLFLRRKDNYIALKLKHDIGLFFANFQDVTLNGVEKPVAKYVKHVWQNISFDDYVSLLKKTPNKAVTEHEIYIEYRKKIKSKNEKEFWEIVLEKENEKLYYFITVFAQKVVLVKSGEKDAEKRFLGYEFSNRRGSEGIHAMQRGKEIEDCTQLFDAEVFDNPTKASTYIYQAFNGDYETAIDPAMQNNVFRHNLVDMMTFDRVDFEKNISLSVKKKVRFESKWELKKIGDIIETLESGKRPKGGVSEYQDGIPSLGGEHINLDGTISLKNMKFVPEEYYNQANQGFLKDLDILICKDGALTGKTSLFIEKYFPFKKGMINEHVFLLRTNQNSNQKYLFSILYSKFGQEILKLNVTGTAQGGLNRENLLNIQIPLPPLEIQEKIVAEIEVLEAKEKKAKEEVESLKYSISKLLKSENKIALVNLLEDINPSKSETSKLSDNTDVSFLSMADVSNLGEITNLQTKKLKDVKTGFTYFQESDVLVAKITPCMENGKGALVSKLKNNIGFGSTEFFVLRVNKDKLLPKILFYFTQSNDFRINAEKEMTGTSGHRRVPKSFIEKYEISNFTLPEQQKIVSEIEKTEAIISVLEKEIEIIPTQKAAILKKYL